jgi:hypothetical protein
MNTYGVDKGVTLRVPATANLMIDSQDGTKDPTGLIRLNPWNFQIFKKQSVINGFFTRVGTTEVVLEWNNPNISGDLSNNELNFIDASGVTQRIILNPAFYTVEQILERLKTEFGNLGITMDILYDPSVLNDYPCNLEFSEDVEFLPSQLTFMLGLSGDARTTYYLTNVDLRAYRYLDFVSSDLTYAQDVKDSSTNAVERDVLCRWYMTYDNATPQIDAYGFPVLMGYTPFFIRRLYNPPKQIKWDNNLPLGQLNFQVYGATTGPSRFDQQIVVAPRYDGKSNWLMTLQLSEN